MNLLDRARAISRYYAHRWPDETIACILELIDRIETLEARLLDLEQPGRQRDDENGEPATGTGGEAAGPPASLGLDAVPPYLRDL